MVRVSARVQGWTNLLAVFFVFGATMSGLAALTLSWPGSPLDRVWMMNPEGRTGMIAAGQLAVVGMAILCAIMSAIALGLFARRCWAWWAAAAVLAVNALGDLTTAIVRREAQTLIGVPIAGLILFWMTRHHVRARFR